MIFKIIKNIIQKLKKIILFLFLFQGFDKIPYFSHLTKRIGIYFFEHKKENMITPT
jgi:hypothetical protein